MPRIPLHTTHVSSSSQRPHENPLPPLLHTPSGLALLELQGTIHFPPPSSSSTADATLVGKLVFPLYNPDLNGAEDTKWMKTVYFYVGKNQRLSGEVKKLGRPFAVIRKKLVGGEGVVGGKGDTEMGGLGEEEGVVGIEGGRGEEELEIVEIVRYKAVFSTRPEPVS